MHTLTIQFIRLLKHQKHNLRIAHCKMHNLPNLTRPF